MSAVTPYDRNNIALFQPNQIAGLALWLDAADSSTVLTSGSSVTAWNDKSGNRYNATAFGTPTYVNNAVNNLSAVRFNGTSSYFTIPGNQLDITTEDFAIFAVLQYTPRVAQIPIIGKGVGALTTQQWRLSFDPNSSFQILILKNSVAAQSSAIYSTAGWTLFGGVVYRATTIQGFTNGNGLSATATSGVVGSLSDTATAVEIGRGWSGFFFNSDMGEILLYKGTISTTQRQQIESYLAYKWNLQSSLPTTHPYYNSPYNALPSFTNINQIIRFAYPILPNQVPGLALWLDAADANSVVTTGSSVTRWNDKSGNGRIMNVSGTPTYTVAGQNGLNVISVNGSQSFQTSTSLNPLSSSNQVSAFVVLRQATIPPGLVIFFLSQQDGAQAFGMYFGSSSRFLTNISNSQLSYTGVTFGSPQIYEVVFDGTTRTMYVNGNFLVSNTIAGNSLTTVNSALGALGGIDGYGCEFLFFNTALATNQRQAIEGYLAWKWGLQASLPSTHPYFNNAFIPNMVQSVPRTITMYIYNPRTLSGLALWLDAVDPFNNGTKPISGTIISTWYDKSGNGRNVTTANGIQYIIDSQNRNAIYINNSQSFSIPSFVLSATSQISVFCVINQLQTVGAGNVDMIRTSSYANFTMNLFISTNNYGVYINSASPTSTTTFSVNNRVTICEIVFNVTSGNTFVNGATTTTFSASAGTALTTSQALVIGGNSTMNMNYYELLFYSTTLTTNQRQQVEGYLAHKWNLQKSLPSNHPFYLFPPG